MTQPNENFFIRLDTKISSESVWVINFKGSEGCSQLFNYHCTFVLKQPLTDINALVGKIINFSIHSLAPAEQRNFSGLLIGLTANFEQKFPGWYCYEAEIAPWLWLLGQRKNCRIFPGGGTRKEVTVVEVMTELFKDYNKFAVNFEGIKGHYPARDFWLQYNETDLAFLMRILSQHGIFYYFKHEENQHILILADNKNAYSKQKLKPNNFGQDDYCEAQIKYLKNKYQLIPAAYTTASHNYLQPHVKLHAKTAAQMKFSNVPNFEPFTYSNSYVESDQGNTLIKIKMASCEAQYHLLEMGTNLWMANIADLVHLNKQLLLSQSDKDFVVTYMSFEINNPSLPGTEVAELEYSNIMECIPAEQVFYSNNEIALIKNYQLHEAIVVGPETEQIYTDDLGRVRVSFFWDHLGTEDINSSCWIRVASDWEGILRVGTPVLVAFIDGDIDQPVVIGPLYDGAQKPLFKEKTMSGLKRRHGKNGDDSFYNELRFNDKEGAAHVLLHATKDMDLAVDHDLISTIKNNETHKVTKARQVEVLEGNDTWIVDKGNIVIKANQGKYELNVQGDITIKSAGNIKIHAAEELNLSAGIKLDLSAKVISVAADAELELKGGANTAIKGALVEIN